MNTQNAHEYLPLVQALADGKTIQVNYEDRWTESTTGTGWKDRADVDFYLSAKYYRIKPEPRMFEIWVHKEGGDIHHWIPPNWNEDNSWERITVQEVLK